jgi:hypothetical protein
VGSGEGDSPQIWIYVNRSFKCTKVRHTYLRVASQIFHLKRIRVSEVFDGVLECFHRRGCDVDAEEVTEVARGGGVECERSIGADVMSHLDVLCRGLQIVRIP